MNPGMRTAVAIMIASATIGAFGGDPAPEILQVPDVRIIAWTIDDSVGGNGDGGLQPGEEADLLIYLAKVGQWPDLAATGGPAPSLLPVRIRVATTRPCAWEIPLRLEIFAAAGYFATREFTLVMVDPQRVDLAAGKARPFYFGADDGDSLGSAVAAGDLDGDGFDDSDVVPGPSTAQTAVIYGADNGDQLGRVVAAGDLNGDGFDDLILGGFSGEVVIVYGKASRHSNIDLLTSPAGVDVIRGAAADFLGYSVSSGDVNGDGFDDAILGMIGADGPMDTRQYAGAVAIVYGHPGTLRDIDLDSGYPRDDVVFLHGSRAGDRLGWSVAAGDLDGDGFNDLILAAPNSAGPSGWRIDGGEVAIVYGDGLTCRTSISPLPRPASPSYTARINRTSSATPWRQAMSTGTVSMMS